MKKIIIIVAILALAGFVYVNFDKAKSYFYGVEENTSVEQKTCRPYEGCTPENCTPENCADKNCAAEPCPPEDCGGVQVAELNIISGLVRQEDEILLKQTLLLFYQDVAESGGLRYVTENKESAYQILISGDASQIEAAKNTLPVLTAIYVEILNLPLPLCGDPEVPGFDFNEPQADHPVWTKYEFKNLNPNALAYVHALQLNKILGGIRSEESSCFRFNVWANGGRDLNHHAKNVIDALLLQ